MKKVLAISWYVVVVLLGCIAPVVSLVLSYLILDFVEEMNILAMSPYFQILSYYILCLAMHLLFVKVDQKYFEGEPSIGLLTFAVFWWTIALSLATPNSNIT